MAQLRDKLTSALLAEGTPEEMVLLANEIGMDEILFDDVGLRFDPDAVHASMKERREGLQTSLEQEDDEERRDSFKANLAEDAERHSAARAKKAEAIRLMEEARSALS